MRPSPLPLALRDIEIVPWYPPLERAARAPADESVWDELEWPFSFLLTPDARTGIRWHLAADPGPVPDSNDRDAVDAYARHLATARFAQRVLRREPRAWKEALQGYRNRLKLPALNFDVTVDDDDSVRIALELPPESVVRHHTGDAITRRARYEEICCGLVLAFVIDTFRVLPEDADEVYVTGYRRQVDPTTGLTALAALLRLATERAAVQATDVVGMAPVAAFEHLGGVSRKHEGELVPLALVRTPDAL